MSEANWDLAKQLASGGAIKWQLTNLVHRKRVDQLKTSQTVSTGIEQHVSCWELCSEQAVDSAGEYYE